MDCDTHDFFRLLRTCCEFLSHQSRGPSKCTIWGHFSCVASWFFRTTWCSFATYLSSRGKLTGLFAFKNRAKFVLIIFHLQLINSGHADRSMADKSMVTFLLKINMLWLNLTQSEKPWHHTENISSRAFQCATWLVWNKFAAYIEMHHATSKTLLRKRQKNSWVSRSTGKSSNRDQEVNPI